MPLRGLLASFLALMLLLAGGGVGLAHGPEGHGNEPETSQLVEGVEPAPTSEADNHLPVADEERAELPRAGIGDVLRSLHPATVHFPIAFFLLAGLLEVLAISRRSSAYSTTVEILVIAGAIGAVLAAAFGWIHTGLWLAGDLSMQWHRWIGTGIALAGILMLFLLRLQDRRYFRALLALVCVAVLVQGYWGGELAHGPNHLTATH